MMQMRPSGDADIGTRLFGAGGGAQQVKGCAASFEFHDSGQAGPVLPVIDPRQV